MFQELGQARCSKVRPLFTRLPLSLAIEAVMAGNTPARLWVDTVSHPASVLLWDTHHGYFLAGAPDSHSFNLAAQRWVGERIAQRPFYAKIHSDSPAWEAIIPLIFRGAPLVRAERVIFALKELKIEDWADRVPRGFFIAPISEALLGGGEVANAHRVTEEISGCWNSLADFHARGFGFCLVRSADAGCDQEIVCWCTAEYVSPRKLGIGIETLAAYQGRGFATLTAAAFAQRCRATGLTALQFKKVGRFWSARVGLHYRVPAVEHGADLVWFRIGSHADYDRLLGHV